MVKTILIWVLVGMLLALFILWLATGGIQRVKFFVTHLTNPIDLVYGHASSTGGNFLPWQIKITQGPDISQYVEEAERIGNEEEPAEPLTVEDIQDATDKTRSALNEAKVFGTPSPYRGEVHILDRSSDPDEPLVAEYIQLEADPSNGAPISIVNWSLQSVLSGARAEIPPAATLFVSGTINPVSGVVLAPGAVAYVSSGFSPVGVSFKENICSGYLAQFQKFSPGLSTECPSPRASMPETPENIQHYRPTCFDFVESLPTCTFPGSTLPDSLSASCQAFVTNTYTYNGCVNMYQFRTNFRLDRWRLYVGVGKHLWGASHDIIRLLDDEGRTVDVLKY